MIFENNNNLRSFGRSKGRPLSINQKALLENLLPELRLPLIKNPKELKPDANEVWFEIGFGAGDHLIEQAKANNEILIIGAEPFQDGVVKVLKGIEDFNLSNLRIIDKDCRPFLENFEDNCLDRVFILFPDPWHKAKHNKRRIINDAFVENLARIMKKGAKLRFASDWEDYANVALFTINKNPNFEWIAKNSNDWQVPPEDHFTTRYETKKLGDCAPIFLDFVRV